MTTLTGVGIGRGIAVGPVLRMPDPLPEPATTPSTLGPDSEKERVTHAIAATAEDIRSRAERVEGTAREVLEAQALMVDDPALRTDVDGRIDNGATAERAVHEAMAVFRDTLAAVGGYLGERAADLDDVSQRIVARLAGVPAPGIPESEEPFVLVARDLAPADTALLDPQAVLAIVTSEGGRTSHTAILAREKGFVAIVGCDGAREVAEGTRVIVDAATGTVTVDPTDAEADDARRRAVAYANRPVAPIGPGRLADGTEVPLLANLGSADGVEAAVEAGAEGVGLFRTEFLFLDAAAAPSVDAQAEAYRAVLAGFPGKKVVVRALDAGADKPLSFLTDEGEENPALGRRGLRALRAHEEVLRGQLEALARAQADTEADVWVMAPMVSTAEEARWFAELARGLGLSTAGVMVEVPSAALIADRMLTGCDFASIGTNDLTQYTMAADRLLDTVSELQDPWHPAVLKLVGEVGAAGAALGKPVGVCGEAAADPLLAAVLVGLGVSSLSMSAPAIADVRTELAAWTLESARKAARAALVADDAADALAAARAHAP